jgi:hypothetical protein
VSGADGWGGTKGRDTGNQPRTGPAKYAKRAAPHAANRLVHRRPPCLPTDPSDTSDRSDPSDSPPQPAPQGLDPAALCCALVSRRFQRGTCKGRGAASYYSVARESQDLGERCGSLVCPPF